MVITKSQKEVLIKRKKELKNQGVFLTSASIFFVILLIVFVFMGLFIPGLIIFALIGIPSLIYDYKIRKELSEIDFKLKGK